MALTERNTTGQTNNTSVVVMLSAPSSGFRRIIKHLTVYNADTASAVVNIRYDDSGTYRTLCKTTLAVGDTLELLDDGQVIVLDDTGAQINITLNGAVTTTQLPYTVHYAEVSA
jgi:hypothetical protein